MRAACLALLALCACPPPAPPPLELRGDGWTLTALDGGTLAFARDGAALVTLPPDAFQVGVVSRLEAGNSYDPYWLVVNDGVFTPVLPMGFAWRAATEATVKRDGEELLLSLTYTRSLTATGARVENGRRTRGAPLHPRRHQHHRLPARARRSRRDRSLLRIGRVVRRRQSPREAATDAAGGGPQHRERGDREPRLSSVPRGLAGFPRPPADWATGPWIWRDESRDQAEVEDDVRQLRALDLPTSGLWIDRPYATEVNTFDYDRTKFPDAGGMVSTNSLYDVGHLGIARCGAAVFD